MVSGARGIVDDEHKIWDQDTDEEFTWWDLRPMMIQIPYFDYVKLKKWIKTECKASGQCDKRISSWDSTLDNIDLDVKRKMELK